MFSLVGRSVPLPLKGNPDTSCDTAVLDHNFQDFVSRAGLLINGRKSQVFRKKNCLARLFFAFGIHAKYGLVEPNMVCFNLLVLQTRLEGL